MLLERERILRQDDQVQQPLVPLDELDGLAGRQGGVLRRGEGRLIRGRLGCVLVDGN